MKSVLFSVPLFLFTVILCHAQVGIGTTEPKAFLNVIAGRTVLFGADTVTSSASGPIDSKLIWYASKGAFRVGSIDLSALSSRTQWNYENVGKYSFASGVNTIASGIYSTALGYMTTASNLQTMALGYYTTASGRYSMAIGYHASTNGRTGSLAIGDGSPIFYGYFDDFMNDADFQLAARFANGYKLFTSTDLSVGASLGAGQTAWSTLSDSTRKENYRPVDGTLFLQEIARMRLGSWNYKGQDVKQYRHYGPMAQDFFAAFGHDELGTIGEDKSINQADFDGVNLIAIQALIKEVEQLKAENQTLRAENKDFQQATASLRSDIDAIKQQLSSQNRLSYKPE